jgi:hypothetical protein
LTLDGRRRQIVIGISAASMTSLTAVALLFATSLPAQRIITTIAGTDPVFSGEGRQAGDATLGRIRGVAIDRNGKVFFTDADFGVVLSLGPNNTLEVISGHRNPGFFW